MNIRVTWGWRISLEIVLIVAPLVGLLVFKLDAESRSAQALAHAFPQQLMASDAYLEYQGFVDGYNDAAYSGALSERAVKGLAASQAALRDLAASGVIAATELADRLARLESKLHGKTSVEPLLDDKNEIATLQREIQAQRLEYQEVTSRTIALAHQQIARQTIAVIASVLFVIAVAVFLVRSLVRGLTQPLKRGVELANQIAAGDLRVPPSNRVGSDETAQLLRALAAMAAKLENLVRRVKVSTGSVDRATAEVASGNLDLSRRTERTAQSIQEMLHSVAKLSESASSASDNARRASTLASDAKQAALEGGKIVDAVRATMDVLAASSKQMLEITSVIDSIATQTNILAFNAASTASRAGEQGRVFTVVASEIRALAQRCAKSANEISSLLGANVGRIEAGVLQIIKASGSMEAIITKAGEVDGVVGTISQDVMNQNLDIQHVRSWLTGLDGMTHQNAALVQEISATSDALKRQTADLSATVSYFIVTEEHAGNLNARSDTDTEHSVQAV